MTNRTSLPQTKSGQPGRVRSLLTGTVVAAAAVLGACSTVGGSPVNQDVAIRTTQGGERVEAVCYLSNDKATWQIVAPQRMAITRSSQPLKAECRGADGTMGRASFPSDGSGVLGGGDARFSYPETMVVDLNEAAGQNATVVGSNYAPLESAASVPFLDDAGRDGYQRFLSGAKPRAFAISETGNWVRVNASQNPGELAVSRCQAYGARCKVYAVDDTVVWVPAPARQAAR